jgi:hypothetical protein
VAFLLIFSVVVLSQESATTAAIRRDPIRVASGIYQENITSKAVSEPADAVALYSGFAGTETSQEQRTFLANLTILHDTPHSAITPIPNHAAMPMTPGISIRVPGSRFWHCYAPGGFSGFAGSKGLKNRGSNPLLEKSTSIRPNFFRGRGIPFLIQPRDETCFSVAAAPGSALLESGSSPRHIA